MKFTTRILLPMAVLAAICVPVTAQTLHYINYPTATDTFVLAVTNINAGNHDSVVGYYLDPQGAKHGFLLRGNNFTTIDYPGGTDTILWGVRGGNTNRVLIVGSYTAPSGDQAFGYMDGVFQLIQPPGALQSHAYGDSSSSFLVVAGDFLDQNNVWHGYAANGAPRAPSYTTLDVPGAIESHATNTSKDGWVTMQWKDSNGHTESSLYNAGAHTFTTINVPGATDTYAHGVNSIGDVVFSWLDAQGKTHGALLIRKTGVYTKFDPPDCVNTSANGITDFNIIVGSCEKSDGHSSGFWLVY